MKYAWVIDIDHLAEADRNRAGETRQHFYCFDCQRHHYMAVCPRQLAREAVAA